MSDTYDSPSGIGSTTASCAVCRTTIEHNSIVCLSCCGRYFEVKRRIEKEMGLEHGVFDGATENRINARAIAFFRGRHGRDA